MTTMRGLCSGGLCIRVRGRTPKFPTMEDHARYLKERSKARGAIIAAVMNFHIVISSSGTCHRMRSDWKALERTGQDKSQGHDRTGQDRTVNETRS